MRKIVYMFQEHQAPRWLKKLMPDGYPIELFDPDANYSIDTVFYYDMYGYDWEDLIPQQLERGHRVIYDAKNEHYVHWDKQWVLTAFIQHPGQGMFLISGEEAISIPGVTIQATPYWYWIVDQSSYRHFKLDQIKLTPNYDRKFFMPLRLQKPSRDYLYDLLTPMLSESLHSYQARGICLPDDTDSANYQRYLNPSWLDRTCFTLVAESYVEEIISPPGFSLTNKNNLFLSEKTYKPLAAQHPFMLVGTYKNLNYVRHQGFETFPELWDESYDDIPEWTDRVRRIVEIIKQIDIRSFDASIVKEKLEYNQARFFNTGLIKQLCNDTVIHPIINFANSI